MDRFILYIGNKNYSSWSFRPWMALTGCGIDFEERLIPFDFDAGNPRIREISPTGRVPVLYHGDICVWESLAIIEYAAEIFPDAGIWPTARRDRAVARSVSMEMLSGFRALRNACPMNMRRKQAALHVSDDVRADVERIETIWRELRTVSGAPFLFGAFSAADAMFAPVVNRFDIYDLVHDKDTLAYIAAVKSHPAWVEWQTAAVSEPWVVAEDEV